LPGYAERLDPAARAMLDQVLSCSAIGSPATVRKGLLDFIARTGADELMITSQMFDHTARLRSYEIVAEVRGEKAV
jgi:alkanesulfonate monooxygenase SsuD/methylene tetrahydromethanopterin reductase-like flavin-dependent oxidoreductase (luciferase family)